MAEATSKELELEALALSADALRRTGRAREAIEAYLRLAHDPKGAAYAEEALLEAATISHGLSDHRDSALGCLDEAERRFPGGPLASERTLLAVTIFEEDGDLARAGSLLTERPRLGVNAALLRKQLEIGKRLGGTDRALARALLVPLLGPEVPNDLQTQARAALIALER